MSEHDGFEHLVGHQRVTVGCDEAFASFDEWAGRELSGEDARELMPEIAVHLEHCPCCAEDFRALLARLRDITAGHVRS